MEPPQKPTLAQPPHGRLDRQYSIRSSATVHTLEDIEQEVNVMSKRVEEVEGILQTTPPDQFEAGLRGELAQLHGNANKLLATRIDAILTSELISGRDDARAIRKQLIKDVEKLIDKVEEQVKRVDKLKGH